MLSCSQLQELRTNQNAKKTGGCARPPWRLSNGLLQMGHKWCDMTMWFHLDLNLNPFYLPHLILMPTSWLKVSEWHLQAKETLGLNWNVLLSDFKFLFPLLWRISTSTQIAWLAIVKIKAWLGFASNATRTSRQFLNSDSEFPYMLHHASHRWSLWAFSCWDASKR